MQSNEPIDNQHHHQQHQQQHSTNIDEQRPFNPLQESVIKKPYTTMNVEATPEMLSQPIPEATFVPNRVSANEKAYQMVSDENASSGNSGGNQNVNGGQWNQMGGGVGNQMNKQDTEMGARQLATMILDAYEGIHQLGNKQLQFSERNLRKLQKEGLIDLSIPVPIDASGNTLAAGEFIEEINKNNENTLTVSPKFKKDVMPVLTRVLEKRGAGMTDEQMLMYLFGKDLIVKGVMFVQVKSTMKEYLEQLKELTEAYRGTPVASSTPSSPSSSSSSSSVQDTGNNVTGQQSSSSKAPVVTMTGNEEDFNFKTNETFQQTVVQHTVPKTGKQRAISQQKTNQRLQKAAESAQALNNTGTATGLGMVSGSPAGTSVTVSPMVVSQGQTAYEQMRARKKTGARGKRKKINPSDYIEEVDEKAIANALKLTPPSDTADKADADDTYNDDFTDRNHQVSEFDDEANSDVNE